jgi:methyl coenzyme M reductase beta subunit
LLIRGGKEVIVQVGSARLYVDAHQKKRFVIGRGARRGLEVI